MIIIVQSHFSCYLEQAGFREGHSTIVHVFVYMLLLNSIESVHKQIYCSLNDDQIINRSILWQKLLSQGVQLASGNWIAFNGCTPASRNKMDNIMVMREFIIFCTIKHHSGSPITIGNLIW